MLLHDEVRRLYDELRDARAAHRSLARRVEELEAASEGRPPGSRPTSRLARDGGLVISSATIMAIVHWVIALAAAHLGVK